VPYFWQRTFRLPYNKGAACCTELGTPDNSRVWYGSSGQTNLRSFYSDIKKTGLKAGFFMG
jgi:hypothetical protein